MNLLANAISGLEAALLPLASALLLEELTYGGLVRLLQAPRPQTGNSGAPGDRSLSLGWKHSEPNHHEGGGK